MEKSDAPDRMCSAIFFCVECWKTGLVQTEIGSADSNADLSFTAVLSKMKITGKDVDIYMYNNLKIKTISSSHALSINTN